MQCCAYANVYAGGGIEVEHGPGQGGSRRGGGLNPKKL